MTANTRFPHRIKVTRNVADSSVYPPVFAVKVILDTECRIFPSKSGGTDMNGGIFVSDYTVSMPYHEIEVKSGDSVEAADLVRFFNGSVIASYNGGLGANLWFNEVKK